MQTVKSKIMLVDSTQRQFRFLFRILYIHKIYYDKIYYPCPPFEISSICFSSSFPISCVLTFLIPIGSIWSLLYVFGCKTGTWVASQPHQWRDLTLPLPVSTQLAIAPRLRDGTEFQLHWDLDWCHTVFDFLCTMALSCMANTGLLQMSTTSVSLLLLRKKVLGPMT